VNSIPGFRDWKNARDPGINSLHAAHFGRRQDGYDQSDLPDVIILLKVNLLSAYFA